MNADYYLFAFASTHAAISCQRLMEGLGAIMMPTLREITASCGISLRVAPERVQVALERMRVSDIPPEQYMLYYVPQSGHPFPYEQAINNGVNSGEQ